MSRWRIVFGLSCGALAMCGVATPAATTWTGGGTGSASMVAADTANGTAYFSSWGQCVSASNDLGATWAQRTCPIPGAGVVDRLVIEAPDRLFVNAFSASGTESYLFKTLDGGASWFEVPLTARATGEVIEAFAGGDAGRMYLRTNQRMLRTTDGGTSWTTIGSGLSGAHADVVAVSPGDPRTLLVATYDGTERPVDTRQAVGVFRSSDGGSTFARSDVGITSLVRAIAFHPTNPNIVFAGSNGGGVFKSTDGGSSWAPANNGLTARSIARTFAFSPWNPDVVYVSTWDAGVWVSEDAGATWAALNDGLGDLNVSSVATSRGGLAGQYRLYASTTGHGVFSMSRTPSARDAPVAPTQAWAGSPSDVKTSMVAAAGSGGVVYQSSWTDCLFRSADRATTWTALTCPTGTRSVDGIVAHPADERRAVASGSTSLFLTQDGGQTWSSVGPGLSGSEYLEAFAVAPGDWNRIYVHTGARTLRSRDGGSTWSVVGSGLSGANSDVIAVHPGNADVLFMAMYDGLEFPLDSRAAVGVFKSTDGGSTFTRSDSGITSLVRAVAFHPTNPSIVLAGSNGGGVFRSSDGGATWAPSNAGLAARYIARGFAFGPSNPNVVYVATWDDGVYVSEDAGLSWSPLWNGLLDTNVSSVATVPGASAGTYTLVAGTTGGLFTLAQAAAATSGAAVSVPSQAGGGARIGLSVSGAAGATLLGVEGVAIDDPSLNQTGRPSGYAFADGALKYRVVGIVNGATVTVSLAYPAALPAGSQVFKITSSGFAMFPGAVIVGNTVTLTLSDGGAGDADGQANGVIVDPVAVGVPSRGSSRGGGCSTGSGAGQAALALGAAWLWLRRRRVRVDV